jgi:integrase
MLIAAGCNPKQISDRLRHSSVAITFDVYGHLLDQHDAEVLGVLDGLPAAALPEVPTEALANP